MNRELTLEATPLGCGAVRFKSRLVLKTKIGCVERRHVCGSRRDTQYVSCIGDFGLVVESFDAHVVREILCAESDANNPRIGDADLVAFDDRSRALKPRYEFQPANGQLCRSLQLCQQIGDRLDILRPVDLTDGEPENVGPDDRGEIGFQPPRIERVDPRHDRHTRLGKPWQERLNRLTRVVFLRIRYGVFHVGDEDVGPQARSLLEHVLFVAGNKEQTS